MISQLTKRKEISLKKMKKKTVWKNKKIKKIKKIQQEKIN